MQIGLGLYRQLLTPDNFRFANQLGVEQIVVHLENYLASDGDGKIELSRGEADGWGQAIDGYWTYDTFRALIEQLGEYGLRLAAIENFAVKQWSDVLLAGPRRDAQIEQMKQMIRDAGRAVRFLVVDVAETAAGEWIVVEVNDGEMSGLACIEPEGFYANLLMCMDETIRELSV